MVPILINKNVFEPSYDDLKFRVGNCNYFCANLVFETVDMFQVHFQFEKILAILKSTTNIRMRIGQLEWIIFAFFLSGQSRVIYPSKTSKLLLL